MKARPAVIVLAAVILHENAAPIQYVGGALILASVVLLNLPVGRTMDKAGT